MNGSFIRPNPGTPALAVRAREWIRVPALVWCGSMSAMVHFGFVLALNLPWLPLPLGTLILMAREHPFTEPVPAAGPAPLAQAAT